MCKTYHNEVGGIGRGETAVEIVKVLKPPVEPTEFSATEQNPNADLGRMDLSAEIRHNLTNTAVPNPRCKQRNISSPNGSTWYCSGIPHLHMTTEIRLPLWACRDPSYDRPLALVPIHTAPLSKYAQCPPGQPLSLCLTFGGNACTCIPSERSWLSLNHLRFLE